MLSEEERLWWRGAHEEYQRKAQICCNTYAGAGRTSMGDACCADNFLAGNAADDRFAADAAALGRAAFHDIDDSTTFGWDFACLRAHYSLC